jgi:hypothetical protein
VYTVYHIAVEGLSVASAGGACGDRSAV